MVEETLSLGVCGRGWRVSMCRRLPLGDAEAALSSNAVGELDAIAAARGGEGSAFEQLARKYWPVVYRTAAHILGDPEEAADIVQETFVKAALTISGLRNSASFRPWLLRIATRKALNALRDRRRRDRCATQEHRQRDGETAASRDADNFGQVSESLTVRRALAALDPKYRAVLVMKYVENLSYQEIGQALRLTRAGVDARLREGRRRMRELLREGDE